MNPNSYYKKTSIFKFNYPIFVLCLVLLVGQLPTCSAVDGCITFLIGKEKSDEVRFKKSICVQETYRLQFVPRDLPKELLVLEMKNQQISHINITSFQHVPLLTNLTLDNNKISSIHPKTFSTIPELEYLSIQGNNLKLGGGSFPEKALIYLKRLRTLNLNRNPIGFVPGNFFTPLKNLKELALSGTAAGLQIDDKAFNGLHQLEYLDLSNNLLKKMNKNIENSLKQMQLKKFFIFYNPWYCDCDLRWLSKWFMRHSTVKYSDHRILDPTNTLEAEPICKDPPAVKGKRLISRVPPGISLTDFHCKPQVFTKDTPLTLSRMSNVTLSCSFYADPKGVVVWYKDGTLVQKHWERIKVSQTQGTEFTSSLMILHVQDSDAGKWQCHLQSPMGVVNSTYSLKIVKKSPAGTEMKRAVMFVAVGVLGLTVLFILFGVLVFCLYGKGYISGGSYTAGKRRQGQLQSGGMANERGGGGPSGISNWAYSQALHKNSNQYHDMPGGMIQEEIMGVSTGTLGTNSTLTPRKRVMIDDMLHHESVPLTSGMAQIDGNPGVIMSGHETDLSIMQGLELSGATLQPAPQPTMMVAMASTEVLATGHLSDGSCPVHGGSVGFRAPPSFSPCPIHSTLSRSQTPQIPAAPPTSMYSTLPTATIMSVGGSGPQYRPCPLHGDLLATIQRPSSSSTGATTTTTTSAPTTATSTPGPTRGILRSKSPPHSKHSRHGGMQGSSGSTSIVTINDPASAPAPTSTPSSQRNSNTGALTAANTAANAAMSTFVRASQVDDCLTDVDSTVSSPPPSYSANMVATSGVIVENNGITSNSVASRYVNPPAPSTIEENGLPASQVIIGVSKSHSPSALRPTINGTQGKRLEPETIVHSTPDGEAYATAM